MRVLKFSDFVGLNESNQSLKSEMIGDSSVGLYKALVPGVSISYPNLNKVGWNSSSLLSALQDESRVDPSTRLVFIGIGSNDLYTITPTAKNNAKEIRKELARIFPNAEYIVIKGGWGWGGLNKFTGYSEPKELKDYYTEVWEKAGFRVLDKSQGYSPEHHTTRNPGIRDQASLISSIISGRSGVYDLTMGRDSMDAETDTLEDFYSNLESFVNSGESLSQQSAGGFVFDPMIQRVQLGLEFLGIDLPRFGADGLYGPETAESISKFKEQNDLEGDGSSFSPQDMVALIAQLRNNGFQPQDLKSIQKRSEEMVDGESLLAGDQEYLFYLQHQQGAAGAASLIKAAQGEGKLHPSTRANSGRFLTANMPDGEIASQISAAIDADDDQRAAVLFLSYWKDFWSKKKQRALELIGQNKYSNIKAAIDSVETDLPKSFLYTVALIESGLQAKPKDSGTYKGLFAITDQSLKKYVKDGNIFNASDNALAAIRGMEENIKIFTRLAGSSLRDVSKFA